MVKVSLFISIPLAIYTPLSLSRHWSSSCWKHLVAGQIPNRGLKCRELAGLFVELCLKKSILQIVFFNTLPWIALAKYPPPQVVGGVDTSMLDVGAVGRCKT